jgi:hypothetical protein
VECARATRVSLKAHQEFNEKWLQEKITNDVELLGLGDLIVKDVERRQPRSGRLDLLLYDQDTNTRYEVEIQLGATDESHVIRTLEYWDTEQEALPAVRPYCRNCGRRDYRPFLERDQSFQSGDTPWSQFR